MGQRPNILWYCSDQQRFDTIQGLNNPHIHTPRINEFMDTAVTFTHAFCQTQICTPSRSSFLTSQYPSAVGVMGNGNAFFPEGQANRLITRRLSDAGYDVGNVGKLHLAGAAGGQEPRVNDGYRYFEYSHSSKGPEQAHHDYVDWLRRQGVDPFSLMEKSDPSTYRAGANVRSFGGLYEPSEDQDNIPPHLHQTHWCTEMAIEFMDTVRTEDEPWFLTVNPFDPHAAFDAPWEYYRRYNPDELPGAHFSDGDLEYQEQLVDAGVDFQSKPMHPEQREHRKIHASYYAMIEQIDHEFGRLLDYLDATNQRENTIIVFMSDHGEALCDHGLILKGCRFFEGLVRVPLIISWPKQYLKGTISDDLVELIDIAPTLYEASNEELPYWVQGKSLTSILTGKSTDVEHREFVRTEFFGAIDHADRTHATMYRDRHWKLISYHGKDLFELYDLEQDPWEHNNLASTDRYAPKLNELIKKSFDAQVYSHQVSPPRTSPY